MIDWSRVRQLRDEVGASEFEEVVQIFLDEVQETIDRLHQDTARLELEQNMHFLKGSALSLGFDRFSKLCQDAERNAAAGKASDVDLPAILTVYDTSKAEFLTEKSENLS
ncbi:TMAO reductase sytem sensor TorS [Ruegeria denitrificans]|uniref:TMAO reductase sytem sensor TorS n=1 Tax=Ruegeria denitrificans TaxID=1715692 RepID=A0A0P1IHR6_9RHOB|nr:Hpt domain-containing protein [Ruegeria denitrificans]CUK13624.1 TMAO reductase sytem sensor TorS [Ruegeria denitrificans]